MKRKRLKHNANILCKMLQGWRLEPSWERLVGLGPGTLAMDLLSMNCFYDDKAIDILGVAVGLQNWLASDLSSQGLSLSDLEEAAAFAQFRFGFPRRTDSGLAIRCRMTCYSRIQTDERVYTSRLESTQRWLIRNHILPTFFSRFLLAIRSRFVAAIPLKVALPNNSLERSRPRRRDDVNKA